MSMGSDQVAALGALATFVVLGLALIYGLLLFLRALFSAGRAKPEVGKGDLQAPDMEQRPLEPAALAGDLVAIRSNLLAVTRQIEDLERRIRLNSVAVPRASVARRPEARTAPASA